MLELGKKLASSPNPFAVGRIDFTKITLSSDVSKQFVLIFRVAIRRIIEDGISPGATTPLLLGADTWDE